MLKQNEIDEVVRRNLICDYIRSSPSQTSKINTDNSQKPINIHSEDSVFSLIKNYLDMNFEVMKKDDFSSYADGSYIRLIILGRIVFFSNLKLTTSSGKRLEDISHAHKVSILYKLITSSRTNDDLSIAFDRDRGRRQQELVDNKNVKIDLLFRSVLKFFFGFSEPQEKLFMV